MLTIYNFVKCSTSFFLFMFDYLKFLNLTSSDLFNTLLKFTAFIFVVLLLELIINKIVQLFTKKTETDLDDKLINIIHRPLQISLIIIGIFLVFHDLEVSKQTLLLTHKILNSFLLIVWTTAFVRLTKLIVVKILFKLFKISGLRQDAVPALASLLKLVLITVSIIVFLAIWGVDLAPMLTSASIMSAVVLFAAKDTISNFFAGFTIMVDQPYKIGDFVDLSTERGEVVEIGLRSTRIKTRDDIMISIPNAIIANEKIINESAPEEKFRLRVAVGVSYNSDIELVEKILLDIAIENKNIHSEPEPRVRFRSFGDSSLNYELLAWANNPEMRGLTIHELNKEIVIRFRENNIEIPYPQRDLHIIPNKQKKD